MQICGVYKITLKRVVSKMRALQCKPLYYAGQLFIKTPSYNSCNQYKPASEFNSRPGITYKYQLVYKK
jgi:hypothetical protein